MPRRSGSITVCAIASITPSPAAAARLRGGLGGERAALGRRQAALARRSRAERSAPAGPTSQRSRWSARERDVARAREPVARAPRRRRACSAGTATASMPGAGRGPGRARRRRGGRRSSAGEVARRRPPPGPPRASGRRRVKASSSGADTYSATGRRDGQPQQAALAARLADLAPQPVLEAEDLRRRRRQPLAARRQPHAAADAHEERVAEVAPQRRDRGGDGRLADAERVRRPRSPSRAGRPWRTSEAARRSPRRRL